MQDTLPTAAMQPFIHLAQRNAQLMTEFVMSPEIVGQLHRQALDLFAQGQAAAMQMFQSNAFARLSRGMVENYSEFMRECAQGGVEVLAEGQRQMRSTIEDVSDAAVAATGRAVRQGR